jgi:NADPH-dependent curcumin reductase CurA
VGGPLLDTVLTRLAVGGRVVICGAVSQYGLAADEAYRYANIGELLMRRAQILGYWVTDYNDGTEAYFAELRELYLDGSIKLRPPHVVDGLEAIPGSLSLLLDGRNTGKLMAQVSPLH